jgi:hypothetical protein
MGSAYNIKQPKETFSLHARNARSAEVPNCDFRDGRREVGILARDDE